MDDRLLQWRPEFALGIPAVDREHRTIIELINRCYAELGATPEVATIENTLGEIHAAIAGHFAIEERIMRMAAYADYAAHKQDHEELLDQIRGLMDAFVTDPAAGRLLLVQHLNDWFGVHFKGFDARLHGQLGALRR